MPKYPKTSKDVKHLVNRSPPRLRRGSGFDCRLGDPGSIPDIPSADADPLMAKRLKTSSDVLVSVVG